ncbi:gamma-glutamyl-gamma-aminobutyrate hydrolase family protein [Ectobacillus ponti]|uniref:Gamma-glutamyl-gamma-aminobutyrate hydrolase family protein n=1 Tax=Ectobacillus ponti TaxID=2961894 RepID=A0AA41X888_9BACI|nr:gamma-glutamyl-gamma-aminobutyrate hydrolase family protein [Ectobacillus ponti]MCP8970701.1 gamma-glutamyl-gamma-aminobutyrate hydrolase family protein [Ectobacillus ponti]
MKKPIIGITGAYVKHNSYMEGVYVHHDYHRCVAAHGGIPIVLPFVSPELSLETLPLCQGIILSGGEDVDPRYYGQDPHQQLGATVRERDEAEIAIAKYAIEKGIPLLAICRGIQILNVALGGTLIQDIPSQVHGAMQHTQVIDRSLDSHWVTVDPASRLYEIVGEKRIRVNSLHHQAIDSLGQGLRVVAAASDGIIEAVEHTDASAFLLGLQWHPESMAVSDPCMQRIFTRLIQEAAGL